MGRGVSAGGILIGRAITERPDLFSAALIGAGTTDMIRGEFQKNGPVNIPEESGGFPGLARDERLSSRLLTSGPLHDPETLENGSLCP